MPAEKFYDPRTVNGDPLMEDTSFIVRWGPEQPADYPVQVANIAMERPEINRLIRTLRRARDAAFGGDE